MSLIWNESVGVNPFAAIAGDATECRFHYAESAATNDTLVKDAFEECLAMAISYLNANVKNESLYFIVAWDPTTSVVNVVVTDDQKQNDAHDVVTCRFAALNEAKADQSSSLQQYSDTVKFWIKDYLSTNGPFMHYSLVALYTDGTRADTCIL
ncbi:hypothetical protein CLV44_12335 [Marinobacterium halophilum]|uniref:Uncharacterized protein n=1 Tax=Marinobacterium halophilum TaxID=267374 RepID=A0A2P8EQG8_9GAMM|nr:hypothetical protein [Marinobacterium halophilum]PSL11717.1 hypothetical protein CLV44_12335 [Marinobacterium halophilum]